MNWVSGNCDPPPNGGDYGGHGGHGGHGGEDGGDHGGHDCERDEYGK